MGIGELFLTVVFGAFGAFLGALVGAVVTLVVRGVSKGGRPRSSAGRHRSPDVSDPGVSTGQWCGLFTLLVLGGIFAGGGLGLYVAYCKFFSELPPPTGYPEWAAFRRSEMESRTARYGPLLAALAKYRRENGKYPASPGELVERGYLPALREPQSGLRGAHEPSFEQEAFYHVSPDRDQFALSLKVAFWQTKAPWPTDFEVWVYSPDGPGWKAGERPQWPGHLLHAQPAAKPDPKSQPDADARKQKNAKDE